MKYSALYLTIISNIKMQAFRLWTGLCKTSGFEDIINVSGCRISLAGIEEVIAIVDDLLIRVVIVILS